MNIRVLIDIFAGILMSLVRAGVKIPTIDIPQNALHSNKLKGWLVEHLKNKLISYFPLANLLQVNFIYKDRDLFLQGVNALAKFLGIDIKLYMNQMKTPAVLGTQRGEIVINVYYAGSRIADHSIKYNDHLTKLLNRKRKLEHQTQPSTSKKTRNMAVYEDIWKGVAPSAIEGDMLNNNPHPDNLPNFDLVHDLLSNMEKPPSYEKKHNEPIKAALGDNPTHPCKQKKGPIKAAPVNHSPHPYMYKKNPINGVGDNNCTQTLPVGNKIMGSSIFSENDEEHIMDLTYSPGRIIQSSEDTSEDESTPVGVTKNGKVKDGNHANHTNPANVGGTKCHSLAAQEGTSFGVKTQAFSSIQGYSSEESSSEDDDFVNIDGEGLSERGGSPCTAGVCMQSSDNIEDLKKVRNMLRDNRTNVPQFELIEKILEDMTCWLIKVKTLYLDPCRDCNSLCGKHCLVKVRSKKPAGRGAKITKLENYMD